MFSNGPNGSTNQPTAKYEYSSTNHQSDNDLMTMCESYFNKEASTYDAFDLSVQRRSLYLASVDSYVIDRLVAIEPLNHILSFGCGTGRREVTIARTLSYTGPITGIDFSSGMASIASQRGLKVYRSMDEGPVKSLNNVDAVLCLYTFPHLPSEALRRRVLAQFWRSLRSGGILILDVFNLLDKHEWPSKVADGGRGLPPPASGRSRGDTLYKKRDDNQRSYMHYFSLAEISALVEGAGFVITDVTGVGHGSQPGMRDVALDEGCILMTSIKKS